VSRKFVLNLTEKGRRRASRRPYWRWGFTAEFSMVTAVVLLADALEIN
jgi:hypothetical protein